MNEPKPPRWGKSLDNEQVGRIWKAVSARQQPPKRIQRPATWLAFAAAMAVVTVLLWRRSGDVPVSNASLLAAGAVVSDVAHLADGSELAPEPGTRLDVLRSSGTELVTLQRHGRCRYSVTPGGPRRWIVETDLATVEVVGTIFTVDRRASSVLVSVERGRVFVRASGRAQTVEAGETLRIDGSSEPAPLAAPPVPNGQTDDASAPDAGPAPVASGASIPPRRAAASDVLELSRADSPAAASERLHAWLAAEPLHNGDWAIVALRLGTLELERHDARESLRWFEAVIVAGAPATAVEDASARRVLALTQLSRRDEALAAARAFRARWPSSAWSSALPAEEGTAQ